MDKALHDAKEQKTCFRPIDLAREFCVHPNTIRMYEKLGFLTPAIRGQNHYRYYTRLQYLQMKMTRCIFGHPFTNHKIRAAGNAILYSAAKQDWQQTRQDIESYLAAIRAEIAKAEETSLLLLQPQQREESTIKIETEVTSGKTITRQEAALRLGVTTEAIRNWERNDLISPCNPKHSNNDNRADDTEKLSTGGSQNCCTESYTGGSQNCCMESYTGGSQKTCYSMDTYHRMQIIYMLRQAGYGMQAIHRSMKAYEQGEYQLAITVLNHPDPESLVWVGDQWLQELRRLLISAEQLPELLEEVILIK